MRCFGVGADADTRGGIGFFGPVLDAREREFRGHGFAIAEEADDLKDIGPGGEGLSVLLLEGVDGEEEEELFLGHLAFFGGAEEVGASASGASSAFEP